MSLRWISQLWAWRQHVRLGDAVLVLALPVLIVWGARPLWREEPPQRVVVRANGQVIRQLTLPSTQRFAVAGPLGQTWIEVQGWAVRVLADPGPRQYCVLQGWLRRAGQVALCLPNRVSVELQGRAPTAYDSLSY